MSLVTATCFGDFIQDPMGFKNNILNEMGSILCSAAAVMKMHIVYKIIIYRVGGEFIIKGAVMLYEYMSIFENTKNYWFVL